MAVNGPVAPQPEQMMGYFVPIDKAAYVTELLELAFGDSIGVTVYANVFNKIPAVIADGSLLNDHSDSEGLPEVDESEHEQSATKKKKKNKKRRQNGAKKRQNARKELTEIEASSADNTSSGCGVQKMARQLREKYKDSNPHAAPKLMVQYPQLPYAVPVSQEFIDLGVPRKVVQMGCNDVLTPLGELLPLGKSNDGGEDSD